MALPLNFRYFQGAAVANDPDYLIQLARNCGFAQVEVDGRPRQSLLCQKIAPSQTLSTYLIETKMMDILSAQARLTPQSANRLQVAGVADILAPAVLPNIEDCAARYRAGAPYPHVVIDNFLKPDLAEALAGNFPAMDEMPTLFKEPMSFKAQLSDISGKWPAFAPVFGVLQSGEFRALISRICGIDRLLEDPILAGGGLHQSPRSGFLDIHVDANFHPNDKSLHRRLNLLVYLNRDWNEAWGGQFEMWSDGGHKPKKRVQSVAPLFNRAVLFGTTRTSWHGVAPLDCPSGITRKSLALYYYTKERPADELYRDSSVIWMNRSVLWKRALYPAMNFAIATLKPYAKRLRPLLGRKGTFDADKK